MKGRETAQKVEMRGSPTLNILEVVAGANRGASQQQQDLGQRINDPPALTLVRQARKVPQKQGQTRTRNLRESGDVEMFIHGLAPRKSPAQPTTPPCQS